MGNVNFRRDRYQVWLSSPSRSNVLDEHLVSGGHFGFHAPVTRDFQKAPPGLLKDMVCRIQIKRKTAFTSTFLRAYMAEPGLGVPPAGRLNQRSPESGREVTPMS